LGDSGDTIIVTSGANFNTDAIKNLNTSSIITQTNATTITLGYSGSTIAIASGATQTGFGRTGTVNWDTTPKTTTVTAVSGTGYFVDTTTTTLTVNLPVGTAGSIVAVSDYANTAATNNIIIDPNGTDKINGVNGNVTISTNGVSITLLYVDSTRGWKDINDATLDTTGVNPFVLATGGTITTCGNYKIHSFTGPGTFTVTSAGTPGGSTTVDYMVVAGGGGGAARHGGGGGAGGFRESVPSPAAWTASPLANPGGALPVSVQGYPITVGAGGAGATTGPGNTPPETLGVQGNNSIFSTITSTGGGSSGGPSPVGQGPGKPGGSGGGGSWTSGTPASGGSGNTPPVSPSQGNPGGTYTNPANYIGSGGGGATAAGGGTPNNVGGAGATTSISGSPTSYAGGGGGGSYSNGTPDPAAPGAGGLGGGGQGSRGSNQSPTARVTNGTANTGGGGGGGGAECTPGIVISNNAGSGGSGIVVIRYKFQ
jgi:hypothetical protein